MKPSEWIALASILAGLVGAVVSLAWQTWAKRRDDKRAGQLERLNRQLSELYGPLYALYEAGERNWMLFVVHFSHDTRPLAERTFLPSGTDTFPPPDADCMAEYRRRMEQLFMPTNTAMESALAQHADLLVGKRMPDEFSDFLAHVAAAKLLMHRWQKDPAFNLDLWQQYRMEYPHPQWLKHRIRASFEVLKSAQQQLLTGTLDLIDEEELEEQITAQMPGLDKQWHQAGPAYATRF
ncbi:MAG: hypothetical protein QOF89_2421 [Acidobacteriota bacterium]|jgi:hypothetical protein|nr:hypothetical protein [Acidobacteriota bacterium]